MLKKNLPIIVILAISFITIFYKFDQIPPKLFFDEVEFAKLALSLDHKQYIPYSSMATGHATAYFYILLASFKTLGINSMALRLPSAIFGLFSALFFYKIMTIVFQEEKNKLIKNYLPIVLGLILVLSRWFFNFARYSFEATFLLFLELAGIYFLFRFMQDKRLKNIFLTAVFAGLAFNSYSPGRIFFIMLFVFILVKRKFFLQRANLKKIIISTIAIAAIMMPLTVYLLSNTDTRFEKQFFLKNTELSLSKKIDFLSENIQKTTLMFFTKGDMNGRHNYPGKSAINPILSSLFLIGLIISVSNLKNIYNQFFLIYFIFSLIPTILTYPWENPHMLRTYTALPAIVFFIGRSLEYTMLMTKPKFRNLMVVLLLLILVVSSIYEIRTYYKYQIRVFKEIPSGN